MVVRRNNAILILPAKVGVGPTSEVEPNQQNTEQNMQLSSKVFYVQWSDYLVLG